MPTTTYFGWTTPADTDLVKNGASAMRTLGNGIDTTSFALITSLPKITGRYYRTWSVIAPTAGSLSTSTTYYTPIYITKTATVDRLVVRTASTFSGTGVVRLGIYNSDSNGQPSTVLLDAGTVATSAASTDYSITVSQSLTPGTYWLAMNTQTAATTNTYQSIIGTANTVGILQDMGAASTVGALHSGYLQASVTGAFATAASLTAAQTTGITWIRIG